MFQNQLFVHAYPSFFIGLRLCLARFCLTLSLSRSNMHGTLPYMYSHNVFLYFINMRRQSTLEIPLLHLGMIIVGVPYSVKELFTTQGGGSPYGPGHVAGLDSKREIDQQEAVICRALGRRLAEVGLKLQKKQ